MDQFIVFDCPWWVNEGYFCNWWTQIIETTVVTHTINHCILKNKFSVIQVIYWEFIFVHSMQKSCRSYIGAPVNWNYIHCVANVYAVCPVYNVKCLCSISIFDSYDMKTLWFEFGHDIFTGCKMPRLWNWRCSISYHKMAEKQAFQL